MNQAKTNYKKPDRSVAFSSFAYKQGPVLSIKKHGTSFSTTNKKSNSVYILAQSWIKKKNSFQNKQATTASTRSSINNSETIKFVGQNRIKNRQTTQTQIHSNASFASLKQQSYTQESAYGLPSPKINIEANTPFKTTSDAGLKNSKTHFETPDQVLSKSNFSSFLCNMDFGASVEFKPQSLDVSPYP